jgi:hypothetical protein
MPALLLKPILHNVTKEVYNRIKHSHILSTTYFHLIGQIPENNLKDTGPQILIFLQ